MKMLLDVILSILGLIVLFPVFLIVAVAIKIDSPGPVFFSQKRIGKNFKPFNLYKFRSMINDAPRKGAAITGEDDPRITRLGRLLRKTKIDEFPQLFNVLKGDMSLVGPRPEVKKYVERFKKEYKEILKVRPGITDYASLHFRAQESTILKGRENPEEFYFNNIFPEKVKLTMEYMKSSSLLGDLKLIFFTIYMVFYPADAINKTIKFLLLTGCR
jgi:lipopolysaccharide/colanic/teichoic acid biosynthesis glycosyltransferase